MATSAHKSQSAGWRLFEWLPRLAVAGLFVYTGTTKILDPATFIKEVQAYEMAPASLTHLIAFILPWLEVLAAALLLSGWWRREGRLLIVGMLVAFTLAKGYLLAIGREFDCGCVPTSSFLHVLFDGWIGVVTNLVCLVFLAVEGGLEWRRRRKAPRPAEPASGPRQPVPA